MRTSLLPMLGLLLCCFVAEISSTTNTTAVTALVFSSVSDKANFYSDEIVHKIVAGVPRLDLSGKTHAALDVTVPFFTQMSKDSGAFSSNCVGTKRDSTNLYCSYIDFALIMWVVGILLPLFTLIGCMCFCCGRNCCKCCCNNCGGKTPTRAYGFCDIFSSFMCYLLGFIVLAAFSIGGFLATQQTGPDIDKFFDALSTLGDVPQDFKKLTFDPAILGMTAGIAAAFGNLNSRLSGFPMMDTLLAQSKLDAANLDASLLALSQAAAAAGGVCGADCVGNPGDASKNNAKDTLMASVTSMNNINFNDCNKPLDPSATTSSLDSAVSGVRSQLDDVGKQLHDQFKSVLDDPRKNWNDFQSAKKGVDFGVWGPVWILCLLSLIAIVCRRPGCFWCSYCCSFSLMWLYFLIFIILFLPSLIVGDLCSVLPTSKNPDMSSLTAIVSSLSNSERTVSIFNKCLIRDGGNFFDAFNLDKSTISKSFSNFDVTNVIPASSIQKNLVFDQLVSDMSFVKDRVNLLTLSNMGISGNGGAQSNAATALADSKLKANIALTSSSNLNSGAASVRLNISLMTSESQFVINTTVTGYILSAADCKVLQTSYNNLNSAICGNLSKSLDSIWFSSFIVAIASITFLICNMEARKKLSRNNKIAPRDTTYKGGDKKKKKNQVHPSGDDESGKKKKKEKKEKKATRK